MRSRHEMPPWTRQCLTGLRPGTACWRRARHADAPKRKWIVASAVSLATLAVLLLVAQPGPPGAEAQGTGGAWPLTADGRSRVAGWSPDGRTVLVNRWGAVAGNGATRQTLSELWSVGVQGGPATRLSENAVQPVYSADGQRLAYLAFAGDGRWEQRGRPLTGACTQPGSAGDWHSAGPGGCG